MPADASDRHYFSALDDDSAPASAPATTTLTVDGRTLTLTTDTGVFSHGHVDEGTALLIDRGARPSQGDSNLLDLGCGFGAIALALAVRCPDATVWAVDTNHRAVALCTANARDNDIGNVRALVVQPDPPLGGLDPAIGFDGIWSNPPIRIGKRQLHGLVDAAVRRLQPGGEAHLVVHRHLGSDSLARWLDDAGYPTTRRLSRRGFRLLDVTAPTPPTPDPTPP